jgi:hypothetical protein
VEEAQKEVEKLLRELRKGWHPHDDSPKTTTDQTLNRLSHKDFPSLRCARAKVTVKAKDKNFDVFFRSRITAMVATLKFYLDPELSYSWRESSVLAAKAMGRGLNTHGIFGNGSRISSTQRSFPSIDIEPIIPPSLRTRTSEERFSLTSWKYQKKVTYVHRILRIMSQHQTFSSAWEQ